VALCYKLYEAAKLPCPDSLAEEAVLQSHRDPLIENLQGCADARKRRPVWACCSPHPKASRADGDRSSCTP